jgi:transmembrane sensor
MNIEELDKRIDSVLSGWETPKSKPKNAIWQSIYNTIRTTDERFLSFRKWHWVAAASLVAVIVSYAIFYNSNIVHSTLGNETLLVTLPDGSTINLNAGTELSYNKITWSLNRSVNLSGEAFFKVEKGEKFNVITNSGVVSVLGTSFNVLERKNKFRVECFTGKVEVVNDLNSTIITKGEFVNQSSTHALVKEKNTKASESPSWINGDYSYKNEQLATILNDISTHFNITINANKKIDEFTFTGTWNKTMTLEEVLQIVCLPFGLKADVATDKTYNLVFVKD